MSDGDPNDTPTTNEPPEAASDADGTTDEPTSDVDTTTTDTEEPTREGFAGPRVVLVLYAVLVGVGGVAGALVATFVSGLSRPELFGVFSLPATTIGFAAFGAITIAVVLGVPLAGVIYVSRRIDAE